MIGFYKNCEALFTVKPRWEESEEKLPKTYQPNVGRLMAIYQLTMDYEKADY